MIRKTIFWLHLGAGLIAGLVVAMMSLTGVLLTYEHQLLQWDDRQYHEPYQADAKRLRLDEIIEHARSSGLKPTQLTFFRDERMPVLASEGRRGSKAYLSRTSGEVLGPPGARLQKFFRSVTRWHRWFNVDGEARKMGRLVTGLSNLAFLFLILSGAYLWLPRVYRWSVLRRRILFARSYERANIRDFYWHHIFGIWSVIPLLLVIVTAVIFSFSWAQDLMLRVARDEGPVPMHSPPTDRSETASADVASDSPDLDGLLQVAAHYNDEWKTITWRVPQADSNTIEVVVDPGSGRQPQRRETLTLSRSTAAIVSVSGFERVPADRRAIVINRFLHTGELYGVVGQTAAGLVSLASLFLVWTGFAQAWRRLIVRPRRKRANRQEN